jgi:hypothetical protein
MLINIERYVNTMKAFLIILYKEFNFLFYIFKYYFIHSRIAHRTINNKSGYRLTYPIIHCVVIFTKRHRLKELTKSIINIGEL